MKLEGGCRQDSVRSVGVWNGLPAGIVQLMDITWYKQALADLMYDEFLEFDYPDEVAKYIHSLEATKAHSALPNEMTEKSQLLSKETIPRTQVKIIIHSHGTSISRRSLCIHTWSIVLLLFTIYALMTLNNVYPFVCLFINCMEIKCSNTCRFELVESIPENLTFVKGSPAHQSTFKAWLSLLDEAQERVDLAVFYWTLTSEDVLPGSHFPSADQGNQILKKMLKVGTQGNVNISIAQNAPTDMSPQTNSEMLRKAGAAQVRNVDIQTLVGGVLHTKLWVVDDSSLYLGSANMDFRSLTQVKELGVVLRNCSCLAWDMGKIFQEYWLVGSNDAIPSAWPVEYSTSINRDNPLAITLNGHSATVFISSSPPQLTAKGRTDDVDAIVDIIDDARRTIDVAVMDYFPRMLYTKHQQFWPVIDSALRRAALDRGVRVRVLASHWNHTRADMAHWLRSLTDISSSSYPQIEVQAKLFVVPAYTSEQSEVPFGRVNHNKYMVTDRIAYIGTSNWSGDYFTNTGGIGLVVNETRADGSEDTSSSSSPDGDASLRTQLQAVFDRDWNSDYARPLSEFPAEQ